MAKTYLSRDTEADPQQAFESSVVTVTVTVPVFCEITDASTTVSDIGAEAQPGWLVSGYGIPDGATVVSVNGGDGSAVISAAATETASILCRVTEPDPGASGPGAFWSRQELPNLNVAMSLRDSADASWIALGPTFYDANGWLIGQIAQDSDQLVLRGYPRNLAGDVMQVALAPGYGLVIDAASSLVKFENLPTADPGSGGLWLKAGDLHVGA